MKQYTVFFDMHIGAPYEIVIPLAFGPNVVYGGDNHEMRGIPSDYIYAYKYDYIEFINRCLRTKTYVLAGNHERRLGTALVEDEWLVIDGVLFLHGDILGWSDKKYNKWRKGELGSSKLRLFFVKIYAKYFRPKNNTLPNKYIKSAIAMMDTYDCHTVVFGHRHPEKLIDLSVKGSDGKGYRIVNCPRGESVITV